MGFIVKAAPARAPGARGVAGWARPDAAPVPAFPASLRESGSPARGKVDGFGRSNGWLARWRAGGGTGCSNTDSSCRCASSCLSFMTRAPMLQGLSVHRRRRRARFSGRHNSAPNMSCPCPHSTSPARRRRLECSPAHARSCSFSYSIDYSVAYSTQRAAALPLC
jgi:hypothetical protein